MELTPAIDLLGGQVVRLARGDYAKVTVYENDPAVAARRFHAAGARRLHVVDLDGAREGQPRHLDAIRAILDAVPLAVQVGGGIRDAATAERWLDAGASRVVLGTVAVKQPDVARALCEAHPGRIIVAIDARAGAVAVEGWTEASTLSPDTLARDADAWGAAALLYTSIERDGMRDGPDTEGTVRLQAVVKANVIASGGIGRVEHVRALREAGIREAVCGRALYTGDVDLDEAFRVAAGA
jgi:phosphoribosylformimino-5-aminoimidazole carboxamide ribotide isomerase